MPIAVGAQDVRALRGPLLRPGQPPERLRYPRDEDPGTLHAAVLEDGVTLGVVSAMRDRYPGRAAGSAGEADWRIRGMATLPAARNRGIASALLRFCEEHARAAGGELLWCNARTPARGLYERAGFGAEGGEFEIPDIGPHFLMHKSLRSDS